MAREIFRAGRRAAPREVIRAGDDDAAAVEQAATDQGRIDRGPAANGDVEAAADNVGVAIIERQMDGNLRVTRGEAGDERRDPAPSDRHRRSDPQRPARRGGVVGEAALEFVEVGGDATGLAVIGLSRLSQRMATGRARQQLDAETSFETIDSVGDDGRRESKMTRGGGEPAPAHHLDEDLHFGDGVHRRTEA